VINDTIKILFYVDGIMVMNKLLKISGRVVDALSVIILFGAFAFGIYYAYIIYCMYIENFFTFEPVGEQREAWGQMGDFFGGMLNPVFSFIGVIFLFYTIFQNRQELILTRKELKNSGEALRDQAATLKKQKFEDTFFALLGQLSDFSGNITKEYDRGETRVSIITNEFIRSTAHSERDFVEVKFIFLNKSQVLNQYFRILYQILKFIAVKCDGTSLKGDFSSKNICMNNASSGEKFYSNIVRSFVGEDLHYLLAINCFAENTDDQYMKYKKLVEGYEFLEHIDLSLVDYDDIWVNKKIIYDIVNFYDQKAFCGNVKFREIIAKNDLSK